MLVEAEANYTSTARKSDVDLSGLDPAESTGRSRGKEQPGAGMQQACKL